METETPKQKLNAPRKSKRASEKATNLLVIPKVNYIGKYYTNGVTVELTTNHAVVGRFNAITIYPVDSPNYYNLFRTYELSIQKNKTEDEETEYKWGQIFTSSLTMLDFAGYNTDYHLNVVYHNHLKKMTEETKAQIKEMQESGEEHNSDDLNHVKMNFVETIQEIVKYAENEEK